MARMITHTSDARFRWLTLGVLGAIVAVVPPLRAGDDEAPVKISFNKPIRAMAFSRDGTQVAATSFEEEPAAATVRSAVIWDARSGKKVVETGNTAHSHWLAFAPDCKTLLSYSANLFEEWATATGRQQRKIGRPCELFGAGDNRFLPYRGACCLSVEGSVLAHVDEDSQRLIRLWDRTKGKEIGTIKSGEVTSYDIALSAKGRLLAVAATDDVLRLWDVGTGKCVSEIKLPLQPAASLPGVTHGQWPIAMAFTPDSKSLATASGTVKDGDASPVVWDVVTGKERSRFKVEKGKALCVAFSSDGRFLAAGCGEGANVVCVWDVATGKPICVLEGHPQPILHVAFADDNHLASASADGTILIRKLPKPRD